MRVAQMISISNVPSYQEHSESGVRLPGLQSMFPSSLPSSPRGGSRAQLSSSQGTLRDQRGRSLCLWPTMPAETLDQHQQLRRTPPSTLPPCGTDLLGQSHTASSPIAGGRCADPGRSTSQPDREHPGALTTDTPYSSRNM